MFRFFNKRKEQPNDRDQTAQNIKNAIDYTISELEEMYEQYELLLDPEDIEYTIYLIKALKLKINKLNKDYRKLVS